MDRPSGPCDGGLVAPSQATTNKQVAPKRIDCARAAFCFGGSGFNRSPLLCLPNMHVFVSVPPPFPAAG
jgi:hypothetical protein